MTNDCPNCDIEVKSSSLYCSLACYDTHMKNKHQIDTVPVNDEEDS